MPPFPPGMGRFEQGQGSVASPGEELLPMQIVVGSVLCDLKVWSDEEWAALSETERPLVYEHFPQLGWVGGVPRVQLN